MIIILLINYILLIGSSLGPRTMYLNNKQIANNNIYIIYIFVIVICSFLSLLVASNLRFRNYATPKCTVMT